MLRNVFDCVLAAASFLIGRQEAFADDAADGALAPDQDGFDVAAVLIGDQKSRKAWPTGEMNGIDIVAGTVEQVVGAGLLMREMRRDQSKIGRAQPTKEVV